MLKSNRNLNIHNDYMPDKLEDLTEAKWDQLKKGAKIPSTPVFKALLGGSASVGSAIASFQKARAAFGQLQGMQNVLAYVGALDKLDAAFSKFATIKEFKTPEAKNLKAAIDGWQKNVRAYRGSLASFATTNEAKLKNADANQLKASLKTSGLLG